MYDEERIRAIEKRLAAEAQRLLDEVPPRISVAILRDTFVQRQRRRRQIRTGLVAAVAGCLIWLGSARIPWQQREIEQRLTQRGEQRTMEMDNSTVSMNGEQSTNQPQMDELHPPHEQAIPILVPQAGQDGRTEFVLGWYVPEQVEEIDSDNLPPAILDGLSRLLGPDFEVSQDETI